MQNRNTLKQLFGTSLENVASIKINHIRKSRFRPLSLLELPFYLFGILISAIIVVVLFFKFFDLSGLFDGDSSGGDSGSGYGSGRDRSIPKFRKNRFFKFRHVLHIQLLAADESVINELSYEPLSAKDGFDTVAAILEQADRAHLVVTENLLHKGERRLTTWFGGLPLLYYPEVSNLEPFVKIFEKEGYLITYSDGTYRIERNDPEADASTYNHVLNWIALIFYSAYMWIPYFFLRASHRRDWLKTFYAVRKCEPGKEVLEITADEYRYSYTCSGKNVYPPTTVHQKLLHSVQYAPSLGYDKWVSYRSHEMELRTTNGVVTLPNTLYGKYGEQMEQVIRLMTLRIREQSFSYSSGITIQHPVKCPYCGIVYVVEETKNCSGCGAFPTAF